LPLAAGQRNPSEMAEFIDKMMENAADLSTDDPGQ
jgi:hypothetical protein